jgi:hypothetical protein
MKFGNTSLTKYGGVYMEKIIILMKSGRDISTTHDWEELKGIINENPRDNEMVVQGLFNNMTEWVCVKKDCIEGYRNI